MLYIHQYPDWTKFRYDSKKVMNALGRVRFAEGRLVGITNILNDGETNEEYIVRDIIATFAIDGETLTREDITKNGNIGTTPIVEKYRELVESQTNSKDTFEESNLFKWHVALDKKHRPGYRNDEGAILDENGKTIFAGPRPERIQQEITNFVTWFNISQMDNIIKAAIAQFWFLTIRPFNNENGKIARTLTTLLLARANGTGHTLYAINEQIFQDKENYFRILSHAQAGNGDLTEWVLWFLKTLLHAIQQHEESISTKVKMVRFKNRKNAENLTPRTQKIVDAVLAGELPHPFNVKEVAALTGTSHDSALRDIQKLIELNLAYPTKKGGRSTRYSLVL